MHSILRSLFQVRRSVSRPLSRVRPRHCFQPSLESLEERTLLNNRMVVPMSAGADNVTTFTSLQAALTTNKSGFTSGNTITIEPYSVPGTLPGTDLASPGVTNLAIEGMPAQPLSSIPAFTIDSAGTIGSAEMGLMLKDVNVDFSGSGSLTFNTNATVEKSNIVDADVSQTSVLILAGKADNLTNTTIILNSPGNNPGSIITVSVPAGGSSNVITGNTVVSDSQVIIQLKYSGTSSTATNTDLVANNTFTAIAGVTVTDFIALEAGSNGLTLQGNTIASSNTESAAISTLGYSAQNLKIIGNSIHLPGLDGIVLYSFTPGVALMAPISGNEIDVHGFGLSINMPAGATAKIQVQGNDFRGDTYGGVEIQDSQSTGPIGSIDLGEGSLGSLGGNDFRVIYSGTAIGLSGLSASSGLVGAQNNLFSGTAASAVTDPNKNLVLGTPISANAAFVTTLYRDFLHRAGDTNNPNDAGSWVNLLNQGKMTQAAVAHAIAGSTEALDIVVNGLYLNLLNRPADAQGQANLVASIQNGGTLEQVIVDLTSSSEYAADTGSNTVFVESLYQKLLGRSASSAELLNWLNAIGTIGHAGVANDIVSSAEFRTAAIDQFYGFTLAPPTTVASDLYPLLLRPTAPSSTEVTGWVNSGLNVLAIEQVFLGTAEFFANG